MEAKISLHAQTQRGEPRLNSVPLFVLNLINSSIPNVASITEAPQGIFVKR